MIRGVINKHNRGEVDQRALGREDIKRVNNSASLMENFIPSRLGGMQYRPGTEYIASLDNSYDHRLVPFVAATDDTALLDFYNDKVEFIVNDEPITASPVTSPILNGSFRTNIASWTDASTGSATTQWVDYGPDGRLGLTGDGSSEAVSYQTISPTETGVEHFLRIVIKLAPALVKIGTNGLDSFEIFKGTLNPGVHVLNFTPSSDITITFGNSKKYNSEIDAVSFETGSSNLVFDTPLTSSDLNSLRYVQSADVVFCAFDGGKLFQIEHRGDKSWSIVDFRTEDGPFNIINTSNISLSVSVISGTTILTASGGRLFTFDHVGALFKLVSSGQKVEATVSVDVGAGTGSIRVTGVSATRSFTIIVTGFVSGTVTLQRSADDSTWDDVETYTTSQNKSYNDTFDNSIFYYRLYVKTGDNGGADTLVMSLDYASGSIEGIGKVISVSAPVGHFCTVQILKDFGSTDATLDWYESSWSTERGFPSSVEIAEGRLWFGGDEEMWGSVSDAYHSFDRGIDGDSSSILRTIGFGPSDPIKWIKSAGQLILGTSGDEVVLRSSSYGEALTQLNANIKSGSTQGSANIEPVKIDNTIYFVQRSGVKLYSIDNSASNEAFITLDANIINQDVCEAGVHRMAVTRQPETRIYVVLDDGNMAVYTVDMSEEVTAWSRLTMNGDVKDVITLPGADEDRVYVVVERGSNTYLEKMSKFKDSIGGDTSETFDSFVRYTSPGTTITGLTHIEGYTVGVWADGQDRGTYTVTSGQITVSTAWTSVIVGIPYVADYISNKLSGYDKHTVLSERKTIVDTGLVLMNYWPGALKVGPSVALLKDLPGIEDGKAVVLTATISDYSELPFEFDSETEVDPRIYMRATGPVNILALTYGVDGEYSP